MNKNDIDLIVQDFRHDAIQLLGTQGLNEWESVGDIYEIADLYGLSWYHYAILSECPINIERVIDYIIAKNSLFWEDFY